MPAGAVLGLGMLLFVLLVYVHQKRYASPTPVSRLDALHAWFSTGDFCIDAYEWNTPDKARFEGRYYSDKAPGILVMAAPAFAGAACVVEFAGIPVESRRGWRLSSWMACAGSVSLVTAAGGAALFAWLGRWVPGRVALLTVLAVFLGGMPLPYATLMFSHAAVVGCVCVALWALDRNWGGPGASFLSRHRGRALAGHACGWAVASEFTAGLVVLGIVVALVVWPVRKGGGDGAAAWVSDDSGGGWRCVLGRLVVFGVASLPPLLLIPWYSFACFGNPWMLPYSLQASFPEMREGLYAIKWPDLHTAWRLLFHPAKGLLFWCPFLGLALLGFRPLAARSPRWFWLTYAVPLLQWLVISGRVWDWQAGPTLGPRYLAPMIPLLALPCAFGLKAFPRLGFALAAWSIAIQGIATLTDACPSYSMLNPLIELHFPLLLAGELSPNLGMALGLSPRAAVALFFALLVGGTWFMGRRWLAGTESLQAS